MILLAILACWLAGSLLAAPFVVPWYVRRFADCHARADQQAKVRRRSF